MHARDLQRIEPMLRERLTKQGNKFEELWPPVLEELHVRLTDVRATTKSMRKAGAVVVDGLTDRESAVKDGCVVRLASPLSPKSA